MAQSGSPSPSNVPSQDAGNNRELARYMASSVSSLSKRQCEGWQCYFIFPFQGESWLKTIERLCIGAVAGIVSRTATAPVDRVRIIMQAATSTTHQMGSTSIARYIIQQEGILALWRGNCANCVKIVPDSAIMYTANSIIKSQLISDRERPSATELLLSGGLAGAITSLAVYPLDSARVLLATAPKGTYSGLWNAIYSQMRKGGLSRVYFGVGVSIFGNFPFCAFQLGAADYINTYIFSKVDQECCGEINAPNDVVQYLASGSAASSIALTCTYPIWLARTKLQTSGMFGQKVYKGLVDVVLQTWKQKGVNALFRGLFPSMAKVLPANAISYAVYNVLIDDASK